MLIQCSASGFRLSHAVADCVPRYGADKITVLEGLEPVRKR
jgi:hypothetical protein